MTNAPAVMKITKALRTTAPDLLGKPAYHNEETHHQAMLDQLRALGMEAVVWAFEDLMAKVDDHDALASRVEDLEGELDTEALRADALEPYKTFFENTLQNFEGANGSWPAAEPDDAGLMNAIAGDFEKAAETRRIEEEEKEAG